MINLLPPEGKQEIRAARSNTLLIRYNFLFLGILGFVILSIGVVFIYLTNAKATAEATIRDNDSKVASYAEVQQKATQFRNDLTTAKQILDQEVSYTKVILEISSQLPPGVILDSLNLDSKTFGTETTLVAHARSYERALALKDAFQDSPLFSNVYFQSIAGGEREDYPVIVNLNVTIDKDAAK